MGLLDGRVVIVTGAGGGIGRAHALAWQYVPLAQLRPQAPQCWLLVRRSDSHPLALIPSQSP